MSNGFVWYTNYESQKGPGTGGPSFHGPLQFHWVELGAWCIEGRVEKTSDEESDAYFTPGPSTRASGPGRRRKTKSSAHGRAGGQRGQVRRSSPLNPPRPPHWAATGWPERFEFWQGRKSRLRMTAAWSTAAPGQCRRMDGPAALRPESPPGPPQPVTGQAQRRGGRRQPHHDDPRSAWPSAPGHRPHSSGRPEPHWAPIRSERPGKGARKRMLSTELAL